jgi:hypothetical protein
VLVDLVGDLGRQLPLEIVLEAVLRLAAVDRI